MARLAPAVPRLDDVKPAKSRTAGPPLSPTECNFLHLLANSPAATRAYRTFEDELAHGQLTARQRVLLALTVDEINGSKYCLSAHYASGKKAGLSDEEMKFARKAAATDPQTDAMLRFVQEITLQRGDVSDADFQSLRRAGFTDGQITEIIANTALNIFTNYFNTVARTEVDFPVVKPGSDAPLARADLSNR